MASCNGETGRKAGGYKKAAIRRPAAILRRRIDRERDSTAAAEVTKLALQQFIVESSMTAEKPKPRPETRPGDEAPPGTPGTGENVCRACKGAGTIDDRPCAECGGSGIIIAGIAGG
jgi:hypothetical protein